MDNFFIFSAKYLFLLPIAILGIYFLTLPWPQKKKAVVFAVPTLILAYLLAQLGGYLYFDPRPFIVGHFTPLLPHIPDNGFPSDHALLVSAVAVIATYLNRKLAIVLWAIALLIGVARVYVGLHHPIDVAGSFAISILSGLVAYGVLEYLSYEKIS